MHVVPTKVYINDGWLYTHLHAMWFDMVLISELCSSRVDFAESVVACVVIVLADQAPLPSDILSSLYWIWKGSMTFC